MDDGDDGDALGLVGTAALFEVEGSKSQAAEYQASWRGYWRWISVYLILGP